MTRRSFGGWRARSGFGDGEALLTTGSAAPSTFAGAGAPPPGDYVIEPFTPGEIAVRMSGALVNAALILPALAFLMLNARQLLTGWPVVLVGLVAGSFVADLVSGVLHWALDTWFDEHTPPMRRMVIMVREHHTHPDRIFKYSFWHDAGTLSWFALVASAPLIAPLVLSHASVTPIRYALAVAGVTTSLEIVFMLEFHKCGHRIDRGPLVRSLQRLQLVLAPEHHLRHHVGEHDENYCLISGLADRTLGRLGIFRALERVVSVITGAVPRDNDREWCKRYNSAE